MLSHTHLHRGRKEPDTADSSSSNFERGGIIEKREGRKRETRPRGEESKKKIVCVVSYRSCFFFIVRSAREFRREL